MEMMLDFNINGEVLIPFYNSSFLSSKNAPVSVKDILNSSYSDFRNVLFQGELIKLYILLKPDNMEPSKIKPFLESLFFKIELESTSINNNDQNEKGKIIESTLNDLFTINSEKIDEKNYEYDNIVRKDYDEETQTELYEIYKQIIIPKNFLGLQLIMKIEILTKNEDLIDFQENSDTYLYYKMGHFTNEEKFKTLKTLFKEVKIIKPFNISDTKQTDLTMDMSLLQIKIENIAGENCYEDISLKNSKFIKKEENKKDENKKSKVTNFIINEIEILEYETSVDEKETEKIRFVKKYLMKKNSLMQKSMNFKLMEKNFPIQIQSGEDYMLSVRVNKNCFLTDSDIKSNMGETTLDDLVPQDKENIIKNEDSIKQLNSPNPSLKDKEKENSSLQQKNQQEQKPVKKVNFNVDPNVKTKKSVINKMKERLGFSSNHLNIESPMPLPDIYQKSLGNKQLEKGISINEVNKTETNTLFSYRDINEENIKIYYNTPVLLYISCDMFYENLFLCLQLKWYQELNRLLKIEMNNFEYMPGIISQIKFQSLGMFNCNEDKIFKLQFLATKFGFTYLPNFSISDTVSNLRFYIVQTNKIYIENNKNPTNPAYNQLNHLISKTI